MPIRLEYKMERTAISLFMDGKSSELTKFMKGIKTDEVVIIYCALVNVVTCEAVCW